MGHSDMYVEATHYSFIFHLFIFGNTLGMQKFLGQRSNLCQSSDNAGPLNQKDSREHLLISFYFEGAVPTANGSSQARGQIRAAAAGHSHSRSNTRSEEHLQTTPQPVVTTDP